jgi:O-succinylhomoserine sulfhydrylase
VTTLQERLAALEGAEACIATASGMAAILSP